MMSAASMAAMIRAKKKKMEEESGAVKLSGIPMDATDILVNKNKEYGEMLSENEPKERDEEPSIEAEQAAQKRMDAHEKAAPDPHEEDEDKKARAMKVKAIMMKMGR